MRHSMKNLLEVAKENSFGIAAPNVFNMESVEACFLAARKLKAPIILDVGAIHGIHKISTIINYFEQEYPEVVFAINLDHGANLEDIQTAIDANFTSVMIDCSKENLETNIATTLKTIQMAHPSGISVEAELGHVGQGTDYENTRDQGLTKIEDALYFVEQTKVDCLAVAIGTTHGNYQGTPNLDLNLLKKLSENISIPLVLHGGSSTGDELLHQCVKMGIQKINLFTDLGTATIDCFNSIQNSENYEVLLQKDTELKHRKKNIHQLLTVSFKYGYQQELERYMTLFESNNKAKLYQ